MHVSEPLSTRHVPRLPMMSVRDRNAQHASKDKNMATHTRQRRTLLECMSRRTVFRTLSFLSFHDIINLLCADKRLRPFVHTSQFSPWRKRFLKFRACEYAYERHVCAPIDEDSQNYAEDNAFVHAYEEAVSALGLSVAPTHLHDVIPSLLSTQHESCIPSREACEFVISWMLGREPASSAYVRFDHEHASELLYHMRLFLNVLRLSRNLDPSLSSSSSSTTIPLCSQTILTLDADCASTLDAFYGPRAPLSAPDELTEEQAKFVDFHVRRTDLVCVQAYAGTGKTRSLLAYAQRRPHQRFLYITFNAAAAKSARHVFPPNVDCRTMHSVALRHVSLPEGQELRTLRPRDVVRLLGTRLPEGKRIKEGTHPRNSALAPTTVALYILRTLDRYMQSTDEHVRSDAHIPKNMATSTDLRAHDVAEAAQQLWDMICSHASPSKDKQVPCPHDAYVKLLQLQAHAGMRFFADYNALLLDEAQDLSACQTAILLRARGHCGVIVVGDVHQKIYGFRGGSATAFNARLYPPTATFQLTKSFRFGPQVAKLATKILQLKAPPPWHNEKEHGLWQRPQLSGHGADIVHRDLRAVSRRHTRVYRTNSLLTRDLLQLSATLPENDCIYLKTSQNLSHQAITSLLRDGHKLYHGDVSAISSGSPLREFAAWKELIEHVEAEDATDSKLTLVLSLEEMISAPDFLDRLQGLERRFCTSEDSATIVLTTVHQAKGLEWKCVVVADDFSPTLDACTPSLRPQVSQFFAQDELNHMYVAMTRARSELIIPPCILQWLIALDGLFRYRFCEKRRTSKCPRCQQVSSLVQMCEPFFCTLDFDARVETLGCLTCVRSLLSVDDDLHDFVRWIDECGVSTVTGKLTPASIERHKRKYEAKPASQRKRTRNATNLVINHGHLSALLPATGQDAGPESAPALLMAQTPMGSVSRSLRAQKYLDMLDARKDSVERWLELEQYWLSDTQAASSASGDSTSTMISSFN